MITTTNADSVLKSYYLSAVTDQLDKTANPFLARIKQTTADVWGKDVRKAVRYGVNGGICTGSEAGDLPTAGGNNYAQFVAGLKNLYGVIEVTDKAIRVSQTSEGALVNVLNDEMDGLVKSSSFNIGRMLFGDGSGLLATIKSSDTSNRSLYTVDDVRNLAEGMIIDIYDDEDDIYTSSRTITYIDRDNNKIIISGSGITSPTNYKIYVQGSKDTELTGLGAIFGTKDLYGVSRANNTWMNPYKKTNVGALTQETIQEAIDAIEEVSGSKVNFIVCSWDVRRAIAKLLSAYRAIDSVELEGGFKAITFSGIPVVADRFCPKGTMYLLNTDDFVLHQLCDWQWLEGENGGILKQSPTKPTFTATLVKYAELLCYRPAGQGMLAGITGAAANG